MSDGFSVKVPQNIDVIRNLSRYGARPIISFTFLLTARQYGEVVLPDEASGHRSLYPAGGGASELSRCEEGMAHFLPSGYKLSGVYECRVTNEQSD